MATGRSDHPNQVNNVLGFPYIFRGALDVRATEINEEMKLAAVHAIANLAKEAVPDVVSKAYGDSMLSFGKEYLIPKPLDLRLITTISPAVAKAAMDSGVAQYPIDDWEAYKLELQKRLGIDQKLMSRMIQTAQQKPKTVIFGEADNVKVLKAAQIVRDEGIATPIFLGNIEKITQIIEENGLDLADCQILNPLEEPELCQEYGEYLYEKRKRKGVTLYESKKLMRDRNYFGTTMLELGKADAFISGLTKNYTQVIRPAIEVIGTQDRIEKVASMYVMITKKQTLFFADTSVNADPSVDDLLDIIYLTKEAVKSFGFEPRMAMLSYSNFGSSHGSQHEGLPNKMIAATEKAKELYPDLIIDGEIQANLALNPELLKENYPFSDLCDNPPNTFIFPNLASSNITYKFLHELGFAEAIGPVLLGMNKPVHILQLGSTVREIVNMVAIAVVDAQGMIHE
mgnify:CR=1 FL=1